MGMIRHHAIMVTGCSEERVKTAHSEALRIFDPESLSMGRCGESTSASVVSQLGPVCVNGYQSFCIFPDGSKEGWETSNTADDMREAFIAYLRKNNGWLSWAHIVYNDDFDDDRLIESKNRNFLKCNFEDDNNKLIEHSNDGRSNDD